MLSQLQSICLQELRSAEVVFRHIPSTITKLSFTLIDIQSHCRLGLVAQLFLTRGTHAGHPFYGQRQFDVVHQGLYGCSPEDTSSSVTRPRA